MSLRCTAAGLIALWALLSPVVGRNREAARAYFEKARQEHITLLQKTEPARTLAQYNKVLFLFRKVIDNDPTFGAADDSVFYIASLYDEMGRRFKSESYRNRALYYYAFVIRDYPQTKHRKIAEERSKALRASSSAPGSTPGAADSSGPLPRETLTDNSDAAPADSGESSPKPAPGGGGELATVSSIRYWSNDDYTRVVIQLNREVEVRKEFLASPARLYVDLQTARLGSNRLARTYEVNDRFVKQMRVAENRPGVVRVVLDYEDVSTHTMFVRYDPFRIIIDTRGRKKTESAGSKKADQKMPTADAVIPLDTAGNDKSEIRRETPVMPSPTRQGDMSLTRVLGLKVGRVVIDPGHGGKDTGSIGPNGLLEKELVLDVAARLKTLLEERLGTDVVMTRSGDEFVPLEERTAIANQQRADLFVSIHANSSRSRKVSGAETFYLNFASTPDEREVASRENAASQRNIHELENLLRQIALGDYHAESGLLASMVQTSLWTDMKPFRPKQRNRGVKKAPFIVLIGANMPSVLTEIGFISNVSDEKYLKQDQSRSTIAEALYKGVEAYFRALGAVPVYERTVSAK